jgi:peptidyl-prolyl cis-trans isomerase D
MSVGEVSEPVETQFGWHLIKLNSIEGGQTPSFQDVRAQLENELRTELAENQIYDLAESLANITYEQFDSLLPASEQLGLKIRSSEWFTQDAGQGVADNVRVRSAAFAPEVLLENRNSDAIELGDNRMLVLHLAQHEPEQLLPLNKVRMQIIDELKLIKARQQATEAGKQVLEGLRSGGSLEQLAQEQGLDIQDLGYIKRNASDTINKDVINLAFTLAKPQPGSMVFEGLSEATGQYTIVELSGVKMMDSVQASERGGVVQKLGRPGSEAEYQAMLKLLTGQASVQRTPVAELK